MYHPQCEFLMPHEAAMPMDALTTAMHHAMAYPELSFAAAGYASAGGVAQPDLSFHLLPSADVAASARLGMCSADAEFFAGGQAPDNLYTSLLSSGASLAFGPIEDHSYTDNPPAQAMASASGSRRRSRSTAARSSTVTGGVQKKEKQRRERFSQKYKALEALLPRVPKDDRATVVQEAINYIHELNRTVEELKQLIAAKRRCAAAAAPGALAEKINSPPAAAACTVDVGGEETTKINPVRSTYIQRRSKDAFVDVRIVEDEVFVKLTKRKKAATVLAAASAALDELGLQLMHLSGGVIGDCHIYMFNAKMNEGFPVYASAVAKKMMEVADVQ